jgi:hypothetical protein
MAVDVSQFHPVNVADTCSVWNVLSSKLLYATAVASGCVFCCTYFVLYECLYKKRKIATAEHAELQSRMRAEMRKRQFECHHLNIADLQDIGILRNRKRLSKGELSSIAFAMRTRQAFLTDDQKARKLASKVMNSSKVQTTPHLVGWLFFTWRLGDADKDVIIRQHRSYGGELGIYFEDMYQEALRCRSVASTFM